MNRLRALASALTVTLMLAFAGLSVGTLVPMTAHAQAASCSVAAGGQIIIIGGKAVCFPPSSNACPVTVGTLTLSATVTRSTGISPLLVFFDATGTTDSATLGGANNTFLDVNYTWNFGDNGASGTGTWTYGSNPGHNSMNVATGGVAAHLYITNGTDTPYIATVTATDGTYTASCKVAVTAYDPSGSNGFPGTATVCVNNSSVGSGCPSGATTVTQGNFVTAVNSYGGSGKRVLFKCGDTFTSGGSWTSLNGTTSTYGAYGSCVGTTSGRPTLQASATVDGMLVPTNPSADVRITDLVLDGNNEAGIALIDNANGGSINGGNKPIQYTLYNLSAINQAYSYRWSAGGQMGIISSTAGPVETATPYINVFPEYAGTTTPPGWSNLGPSEDFMYFANNFFENGTGTNSSYEVVRDSYASKHIFSNNTILNAGSGYGTLKLHNLNYATDGGSGAWSGIYTQYDEIADNNFGGNSGANMVEERPQNPQSDERLRYIVTERNLFTGTSSYTQGRQILVSGVDMTFRDNVFQNAATTWGISVAQQGIEPQPQYIEVYNNTCVGASANCISFTQGGSSGTLPVINSWAQNNLAYITGGESTVVNTDGSNVITPNTTTTTNNPAFTNGSGTFSLISDFQPTANYSGGTNVPVWYDALGIAWPPTWDLGAVHH